MALKTYSTFAGARRAANGGPIIRILDSGCEDIFIIGFSPSNTTIMALDSKENGKADGSISFLDLSTGGRR